MKKNTHKRKTEDNPYSTGPYYNDIICGACKLIFLTLFHHVLLNLRTLYIVWSQVRRRVTRHLTRLQTMCNFLKYHKIL